MNKLTAEKCREMLTHFKSLNIQGHLLDEGKQILQALEIALPVLEQQDGWIEWGGGDICPLNTPVKVRCRSGMEIPLTNPHCGNWSHNNGSFDIIAYRVIENDGREG